MSVENDTDTATSDSSEKLISKENFGLVLLPWLRFQRSVVLKAQKELDEAAFSKAVAPLILGTRHGAAIALRKTRTGKRFLELVKHDDYPSKNVMDALKQCRKSSREGSRKLLDSYNALLDGMIKEFEPNWAAGEPKQETDDAPGL